MIPFIPSCPQELRPRGLDVKQEELGDLVDKEMAATATAIEIASARIEVGEGHHKQRGAHRHDAGGLLGPL